MYVRPQTNVVSQIPAYMIGIVIEHDVIAVPEPVAAVTHIVRRYREVKTAEPEARRSATYESPYVLSTDRLGKMTMFPGMVEVIVRIATAGVVSDPLVSRGVHVRSLGMALLVSKGAPLRLRSSYMRSPHRSGTMRRNVTAAHSVLRGGMRGGLPRPCCASTGTANSNSDKNIVERNLTLSLLQALAAHPRVILRRQESCRTGCAEVGIRAMAIEPVFPEVSRRTRTQVLLCQPRPALTESIRGFNRNEKIAAQAFIQLASPNTRKEPELDEVIFGPYDLSDQSALRS
jgi:hypothetical protein